MQDNLPQWNGCPMRMMLLGEHGKPLHFTKIDEASMRASCRYLTVAPHALGGGILSLEIEDEKFSPIHKILPWTPQAHMPETSS